MTNDFREWEEVWRLSPEYLKQEVYDETLRMLQVSLLRLRGYGLKNTEILSLCLFYLKEKKECLL